MIRQWGKTTDCEYPIYKTMNYESKLELYLSATVSALFVGIFSLDIYTMITNWRAFQSIAYPMGAFIFWGIPIAIVGMFLGIMNGIASFDGKSLWQLFKDNVPFL